MKLQWFRNNIIIIILAHHCLLTTINCQITEEKIQFTSRRVESAPSLTACMVAQTSSNTHIIPGGFYQNGKPKTELVKKSCHKSPVKVLKEYHPCPSHLVFYNITHNFVVEIINWSPIDSLFHILFLHRR